jgi:hypothetical protein
MSKAGDAVVVLVDWENLRIPYAGRGHSVSPALLLQALVHALADVRVDGDRPPTEVQLHMPGGFETTDDRRDLTECLAAMAAAPAVKIVPTLDEKDMADIEIALVAAHQVYRRPAESIWIVSGDKDMARVCQFLTERRPRCDLAGQIVLAHHGTEPPRFLNRDDITAVRSIEPRLTQHLARLGGERLRRRAVNRWDVAAWTLRHLAAVRMSSAVFDRGLERTEGLSMAQAWASITSPGALTRPHVERVDDAVSTLWRLHWGQSFAVHEAVEAITQGPGIVSRREGTEILTALRFAGLVRNRGPAELEVVSAWREGLLLPCQRLLLYSHRLGETVKESHARKNHRSRFARRDLSQSPQGKDSSDADDSWSAVVRTLSHRKRPSMRRRSGTITIYASTDFARTTIARAREALAALDGRPEVDAARARIGATGIGDPGRWLRSLHGAGLAYDNNGRWERTEQGRKPPWA